MTNEEKQDLELIDRFDDEFKQLCYKHGLHLKTGRNGNTYVTVLEGSSKPALESNLFLSYRGRGTP
jgi:hypothetical protein